MLPSLLREYHPNDTVNTGEWGMVFRIFKDERCHGRRRRSKDTITVLVCEDMDGIGKMPLLVTGKSEKPKCFQHVKAYHIHTDKTATHG
jgi:hypothetical protein